MYRGVAQAYGVAVVTEAPDDDRLMEALRRSVGPARDAAFRALVRRHAGAVRGLAATIVADPEQAEDVVQETFLRVYQARDRYEAGAASFRTWLLRIARNLALNDVRNRRRRRAEPLDEQADSDEGPLAALEEGDRARLVSEAVARLGATEREVIALRFQQGLSYDEIGAVVGAGAPAAKQRTWRALQRLRALLGVEA